MMRLIVLAFVYLAGYVIKGLPADDPCTNHRLFPEHNIGSRNERCRPPPSTMCDYYLHEAWYAMKEVSILTHCPTTGSCGVGYPGWLKGSLPTKAAGIVKRTVCVKGDFGCCNETIDIRVKQCLGFYVFYLKPFDYCPAAYCVESNQPCVRPTPPPTRPESSQPRTDSTTASTTHQMAAIVENDRRISKAAFDPCRNNQEFPKRQFGSRNERCMPHTANVCDYYMNEGWYSIDGGTLLSHCPESGYCGVAYPVWLNGSLPDTSEDVVERYACVKHTSDCCSKTIKLKIRKCNQFYVYYLIPLNMCPSGYCVESSQPCEDSTSSTTRNVTAIVRDNEEKPIVGDAEGVAIVSDKGKASIVGSTKRKSKDVKEKKPKANEKRRKMQMRKLKKRMERLKIKETKRMERKKKKIKRRKRKQMKNKHKNRMKGIARKVKGEGR